MTSKAGGIVREIKCRPCRVGSAVALNRTGGLLAIAHDRAISVFDMADGEQLSLLQAHQSEGIIAQFQPGGDLLASSSWDGTTRLWDPIRGRLLVTLDGAFREWVDGGSSLVVGRMHELVRPDRPAGTERRAIDCRMLGDRAGAALYGPGASVLQSRRPIARNGGAARGGADRACQRRSGARFSSDRLLRRSALHARRRPVDLQRSWALPLAGPADRERRIADRAARAAGLDRRRDAVVLKRGLATSADGRMVGVSIAHERGSMLLDPDHPWRRTLLIPHGGVSIWRSARTADGPAVAAGAS